MTIKSKLKETIGKILPVETADKLTEYSLRQQEPSVSLEHSTLVSTPGNTWVEVAERGRRELWRRTLSQIDAKDILLLEFGVYKGDSMREFLRLNDSPNSLFYGFDSFEGLPEIWRGTSVEHFSTGGGSTSNR